MKTLGFKNTGNSAIYDIPNNPLYAGFFKVAAYRDLPEKLVKGIHEPIITETGYLAAQKMLTNKRPQRIQPAEDFPLRDILNAGVDGILPLDGQGVRSNTICIISALIITTLIFPGQSFMISLTKC